MSEPRHRLFLFWLLGLLALPAVLSVVDVVPNDVRIESRRESIGFDSSRLLDTDYYAAVDTEVAERFPGRGAGQWLQVQLDYELFGEVVVDSVIRGPGDWLHRTESVEPPCSNLARIASEVEGREPIDAVMFAVFAPKAEVVPRSVYDDAGAACVHAERDAWRERTRVAPDYVDVNDAIEAADAAGTETFLEQDGHWTQAGRLIAAEQLIESLAPGLWASAEVSEIPEVVRDMDVLRSMGLRRSGLLRDREVSLTGEVDVEVVASVEAQSAYFPLAQISRSTAATAIEGTTWLLGDSQSGYLLYELEPFFEELVFVNWIQVVLDGSVLESLPSPDRAIFTAVEHNAAGLFASGITDAVIARLDSDD